MFISLNWIKEFVDLDGIDIKEIEKRFTLATAEIEGIEEKGTNIKNVVAGKILSVEEKENLKTTRVVKVDVGDGKEHQTCCGAPNAEAGMIVPVAVEGGTIIGLDKVTARKTGGYDSNCILCSAKEIGISDDHSGLLVLPSDTKLGTDIHDIYPDMNDVIIEIDNKSLTNRPDLWGHYGIAREFAAIFKKELKPLEMAEIKEDKNLPNLDIKIENDKCNRYTGITVKNIKENKATDQMAIRLFYCGMRSISLLVDLTNYLMMEVGQPMHAFDKRTMDKVIVSSSKKDEKFVTLDDEERILPENTMMICNSKGPVAIAGIMGGANTEIKDDTDELLLESANFDAGTVRKSAVKLRLRTDASARYEKSLDAELTPIAIKRFIKLLKDRDNGVVIASNLTDVYKNKRPEISIDITKKYINDMAGIDYSDEFITECLERLEFKVTKKDDTFHVVVPSFRATKDISIKSDLVEEVSRIYGYDNIIPTPIELPILPVSLNPVKELNDKVKTILTERYDANEVHSYVWYDNDFCREIGINPESYLAIINSEDGYSARLRSTMYPTLLKCASINAKNYDEFMCYEIGSVYNLDKNKHSDEKLKLGLVLANRNKSNEELFYEVKNVVKNIIKRTRGIEISVKKTENLFEAADKSIACDVYANDVKIGTIFAVNDKVASKTSGKVKLCLAQIDMDKVVELAEAKITYKAPSIYQETSLDFNFLVNKETYLDDMIKYMNEFKSDLKYQIKLVDVYEGKGIDDDKKSMTYNVIIGRDDNTLTSEEIDGFYNGFLKQMNDKGYTLR
ncbi:MAG: phenylalanine--tRNA ligase subunit beta [Clostridia bacterium]|nr:phenylalanine--tRNA ligase subunit beta [Clostridia bacterium]